MQIPLDIDKNRHTPLQQQLFNQLRDSILMGRLSPGQRIPSSRELSGQLQVSRNTVAIAYDRLTAEGYIESHRGIGMFVNMQLPEDALHARRNAMKKSRANGNHSQQRHYEQFAGLKPVLHNPVSTAFPVDFRIGKPDPDSFPLKTWRRLASRILGRRSSDYIEYSDPTGLPALREAIAQHVAVSRGIIAKPEQVIIVAGIQEALNLASRVLLSKGSKVAVESPTYQNAAYCFKSYGAELYPVPTDLSGIIVSKMPRKIMQLAYVTPSHQFPRGVTMSLDRRLALLNHAARSGMYIFEDDYDGDFSFQGSPLTALQGLDVSESVLYSTTFSKSIGAGLRLGYLIVPPHLVEPVTTVKALLNYGHPWLEQMILTEFINSGQFENHLRRIRMLYMARRDYLVELLNQYFGPCRLSGQYCGLHLAWRLDANLPTATEMQHIAAKIGVGVYTLANGHAYLFHDEPELEKRIIFLGYPSVSEKQMKKAIHDLSVAVDKYTGKKRRSRISN